MLGRRAIPFFGTNASFMSIYVKIQGHKQDQIQQKKRIFGKCLKQFKFRLCVMLPLVPEKSIFLISFCFLPLTQAYRFTVFSSIMSSKLFKSQTYSWLKDWFGLSSQKHLLRLLINRKAMLTFSSKETVIQGLPCWSGGRDATFQCRGCMFNPWSGSRIPYASWPTNQDIKSRSNINYSKRTINFTLSWPQACSFIA